MTLVQRLKIAADKAGHAYRIATEGRQRLRKAWVNAVAALMRAELKAIKRGRI